MADRPDWPDGYDPDAERCCKDCGKTFKTKEGILHNRYEFHCSPCHMWWKRFWQRTNIGIGVGVALAIAFALYYLYKYTKGDKNSKCTKKHFYEVDDEPNRGMW